MADDRFVLDPEPDAAGRRAEAAFAVLQTVLRELLPASATIHHVGATAVPGALTKGDLDICVRVSAEDFHTARDRLRTRYAFNHGSVATDAFQAFETRHDRPAVGIQLTIVDAEFDIFVQLRDRLIADKEALERMNAMKRRMEGAPMETYSEEKNRIIAELLATS